MDKMATSVAWCATLPKRTGGVAHPLAAPAPGCYAGMLTADDRLFILALSERPLMRGRDAAPHLFRENSAGN